MQQPATSNPKNVRGAAAFPPGSRMQDDANFGAL
jgi:hypothetical protein